MTERRQAFRRDPIEVELDKNLVISVGPVSWLKRNDFGNEVMKQHSSIINDAISIFTGTGGDDMVTQIQAKFSEKFTEPYILLELGLEPATFEQVKAIDPLYDNQIVELLLAICDVNKMDQLKPLLDPNFQTPTTNGGTTSAEGETSTPKIASGLDSSSPELTTVPSSD